MSSIDESRGPGTNPPEVPVWADLRPRLDELTSGPSASESEVRRRQAVHGVAARMSRVFSLSAPSAPGLAFVGGTALPSAYGLDAAAFPPANVSGRAADVGSALRGCVGEAVEYLSRLTWGDEPLAMRGREPPPAMAPDAVAALLARLPDAAGAPWLPAQRMGDEAETWLPASLCLTAPASSDVRPPSGSGCAAGSTIEAARLAALLELIERDAAALWWRGGRPARPLAAEAAGSDALRVLRRGTGSRRTWLLDITTDLGVPCVAALSVGPDGRGLACGLSARPDEAEAARSALLELCQMELAHDLVRLKLDHAGRDALAPVEIRHLRRMEIDCEAAPILYPVGPPRRPEATAVPSGSAGQLGWVLETLAVRGIEAFAVDLTRPAIGIPATRVIAPLLQDLATPDRTARLDRAMADHPGRAGYVLDTELI